MNNRLSYPSFTWFMGVVEDINDPIKQGRVRVRCFGFHTADKTSIPTESLPWAICGQPTQSASMSGIGISPTGIVNGSWVIGFFMDGKNAQQPVVLSTFHGMSERLPDPSKGFNDPDDQYPTDEYLNESSVNRLARNENIDNTLVKTKNDSLDKNIPTATDESWSEPRSPYNTQYPKNKVISTESGHVIELDDTPDAERVHVYHKSGTFVEMYPDGSVVTKVKNNKYEIVIGDDNIHVNGNYNITVDGDSSVYVKGDATVKVDGNVKETVGGDVNRTIQGNVEETINGDYTRTVSGHTKEKTTKIHTIQASLLELN